MLIAVSLLTFLIASLLPGDLAYAILGDQATPENVAALRRDMGLDQPMWWRYLSWLGDVLQGDFGRSFRTGQTVLQAVAERLPVSLELMLLAELGALPSAYPSRSLRGAQRWRLRPLHDRHRLRHAVDAELPVGNLLIYLFAVELRWLPATGYGRSPKTGRNLRFMVLPALTLALAEWPVIMRVLRSDMIATLQEDYIALAKAKGLKAVAHPVRARAEAIVADAGHGHRHQYRSTDRRRGHRGDDLRAAGHRPAAGRRDLHPRLIILQGVVLLVAAGFVIVNFIVDMLYAVLDPRIRHGHA